MANIQELLQRRRLEKKTADEKYTDNYGGPLEEIAERVIQQQEKKRLPPTAPLVDVESRIRGVKDFLIGSGYVHIPDATIAQEIIRIEEEQQRQLALEEQLSAVQATIERNERYVAVQTATEKPLKYRKSIAGWHRALPLHIFLQRSYEVLDMMRKKTGPLEVAYEVDIAKERFHELEEITSYLREQKILSCIDYDARILFGNSRVEGELSSKIQREIECEPIGAAVLTTILSFIGTIPCLIIFDAKVNWSYHHPGMMTLAACTASLGLGIYNGMRISHNNGTAYGMNLSLKPAKVDYSREEVETISGLMKELKKYKV